MMVLAVGLVASFQTIFDSLQCKTIQICNNCGLVSAKAMTKARSEFRDIRQLQHAERTQSISESIKCARFHDKAKRHKVTGTFLGCGRENATLSRYLNRLLMVLAVLGQLLSNYFQSV
jgi:hypothetical protein